MENDILLEESFAIPIIDFKDLKKDRLYVTDTMLTFYNPHGDETSVYLKLKNSSEPYPIRYFILVQSLIHGLN